MQSILRRRWENSTDVICWYSERKKVRKQWRGKTDGGIEEKKKLTQTKINGWKYQRGENEIRTKERKKDWRTKTRIVERERNSNENKRKEVFERGKRNQKERQIGEGKLVLQRKRLKRNKT